MKKRGIIGSIVLKVKPNLVFLLQTSYVVYRRNQERMITMNDFESICTFCLSHCKDPISFSVDTADIFKNIFEDILSKYANDQVSDKRNQIVYIFYVLVQYIR